MSMKKAEKDWVRAVNTEIINWYAFWQDINTLSTKVLIPVITKAKKIYIIYHIIITKL